jgi:hypothetical protein
MQTRVSMQARLTAVLVAAAAMIVPLAGPAAADSRLRCAADAQPMKLDAADQCRERYIDGHGGEFHAGRTVAAEFLYGGSNKGMLRARSYGGQGDWERAVICRNAATGLYYFQYWFDRDQRFYFVSVEVNYAGDLNGMLRARATSVGPWELFFADRHPVSIEDPGNYLGVYTLRSYQNGKYVSHESGYPGDTADVLRARADTPGEWEGFWLNLQSW